MWRCFQDFSDRFFHSTTVYIPSLSLTHLHTHTHSKSSMTFSMSFSLCSTTRECELPSQLPQSPSLSCTRCLARQYHQSLLSITLWLPVFRFVYNIERATILSDFSGPYRTVMFHTCHRCQDFCPCTWNSGVCGNRLAVIRLNHSSRSLGQSFRHVCFCPPPYTLHFLS